MYNDLKKNLMEAKGAGNKAAVRDIIGVIDAVDKKVFADKKKAGDDYIVPDSVVVAVLKNQLKNVTADYKKALDLVGLTEDTESMQYTCGILKSFLPAAIEGDDLRMLIQGLGANGLGQAMSMLKAKSQELGFDYDGKEAATISKEIFI